LSLSLSKAGAACLQMPGESSPAELQWLLRYDQLALLAGRSKA
jgi:hypothetical protein